MPSSSLSNAAVVLLGVIALGSLAQAVFLLVLGRELMSMGRRLDAFQQRLVRDLHPLVADITRATQNLAAASELTEQQARRIDGLVTTALTKLVEVERVVEEVLCRRRAASRAGWPPCAACVRSSISTAACAAERSRDGGYQPLALGSQDPVRVNSPRSREKTRRIGMT